MNNEELADNNGNSRYCHGVTIWSPKINIFHDPRWGRGQETYGEDPADDGASLEKADRRAVDPDPFKWLGGVQRVRDIKPGEERQVKISLPELWLAIWSDQAGKRVVASGELTISAGPASDNLMLKTVVAV